MVSSYSRAQVAELAVTKVSSASKTRLTINFDFFCRGNVFWLTTFLRQEIFFTPVTYLKREVGVSEHTDISDSRCQNATQNTVVSSMTCSRMKTLEIRNLLPLPVTWTKESPKPLGFEISTIVANVAVWSEKNSVNFSLRTVRGSGSNVLFPIFRSERAIDQPCLLFIDNGWTAQRKT